MCNGVWKVIMLDSSLEVGRCTAQVAQEFAIPKERVKDYAISIITGNDSAIHVWYLPHVTHNSLIYK